MTKLTDKRVESIKPAAKASEHRDGHVPGLYLACHPSGVKSWNFRYRVAGKARKLTIGRWPAITVDAARKLAQQAAAKVAGGADPHEEKKASRRREVAEKAPVRDTIEKVARQYLKQAKTRTRASTAAVTSRILRVYVLPAWKGKRLSEITKADERGLIADIATRAPVMANRVLTGLKTMYNWAVAEDILTASPCAGLKPPAAETSRDRVLADHEIGQVWRACDGLGRSVDWMGNEVTRPYGAVVKLLALTGQRLREVSEMRWSEIDLDARTWTLPASRCKNGHSHCVPLAPLAIEILESQWRPEVEPRPAWPCQTTPHLTTPCLDGPYHDGRDSPSSPRLANTGSAGCGCTNESGSTLAPASQVCDSDLVFGKTSGFSRAKKALDKAAGLSTPWCLHDLRRTCASGMARLGVAPWHMEACLNHRSGIIRGVAATYNKFQYGPEKAAALALWAAHVTRCANNYIGARPVEARSAGTADLSELEAAE